MKRFWVDPHSPLPPPVHDVPGYPGLIALGADLSAERLIEAYTQGMFPWYSDDQPVLWWSPDPRMVVFVQEFRPARSLRRLLQQLHRQQQQGIAPWQLTLNRAFEPVMRACAAPRDEAGGTWITEDIIQSYCDLHRMGLAHSVEVWEHAAASPPHDAPVATAPACGAPASDAPRSDACPSPAGPTQSAPGPALIAGLYGVAIGRMFFGESMFTRRSNASKCAFAALMRLLQQQGFEIVDCQQSTRHLGSLGGRELPRAEFLQRLPRLLRQPAPDWAGLRPDWPIDWLAAAPCAGDASKAAGNVPKGPSPRIHHCGTGPRPEPPNPDTEPDAELDPAPTDPDAGPAPSGPDTDAKTLAAGGMGR